MQRKERRNFPKIQKRIQSGDSDPEICTRLDKEVLETQSYLKAEKAPRAKYSEDQFLFAKTQTKGKRILFANNRADHNLKTQLELAFEPGELKWCSCDKELENTIRSIETTDYDLILVATGSASDGCLLLLSHEPVDLPEARCHLVDHLGHRPPLLFGRLHNQIKRESHRPTESREIRRHACRLMDLCIVSHHNRRYRK